jgi:hypothetical protein
MSVSLNLDPEDLRPLIETVVAATVARLEDDRAKLNGRLAYSEAEAAELLGLEERQLAYERRRGRIQASTIVGRRVRYTKEHLLAYLAARPWKKE